MDVKLTTFVLFSRPVCLFYFILITDTSSVSIMIYITVDAEVIPVEDILPKFLHISLYPESFTVSSQAFIDELYSENHTLNILCSKNALFWK